MAVSLNDIKNKNCIDKEYQSNYKCYADGICCQTWEDLSKLPRTSKFTHLKFVKLLTDLLHGHEAENANSTIQFLKESSCQKVCLYCYHF